MMKKTVKFLLSLYKKVYVWNGPCCRYFPSCSDYALEAVERHGAICGLFLALNRLIRCNQFFAGGLDPVPEVFHVKH